MQIEKETQIKRRVKSAMVYPTVVLTFARLVLVFMLLFIVPVFVKVFDSLNGTAADADEDRHGDVERASRLLVHHLPRDRPRSSGASAG